MTSMFSLFRKEVVSILQQIHHKGVRHNDFDIRNIVINKRNIPTVVDFNSAEVSHMCGAGHIIFHDEAPSLSNFHCKELYGVASLCDAWQPSRVHFFPDY
ncbi:hypothetical protein AcV5_009499 [Taiwanofungus camphoratus]|nr:hypothetical protein AcV5_009499 [Antrodia cinnamomea]